MNCGAEIQWNQHQIICQECDWEGKSDVIPINWDDYGNDLDYLREKYK